MALFDDIARMSALLREHQDKILYDTIYGGRSMLSRLPHSEYRGTANPWPMPVYENPMFPYEQTCAKCEGTGEGVESTYCPSCKGAGRYRVEGVMVGDGRRSLLGAANDPGPNMAVIMHYYPPKPVAWPAGVKVPKRHSQGIRTVSWPA